MNGVAVPTRIIMAGTSSMKLNERFSNIPPPKAAVASARGQRITRRLSADSQATYPDLDELDINGVFDDVDDDMMDEDVDYVYADTTTASRPRNARTTFQRARGRTSVQLPRKIASRGIRSRINRAVPIESRLSVINRPKVVYVPVAQTNQYRRGFRRPNQYYQQNRQNSFGQRGQFRNNWQNGQNRGFSRGGFRGRGRGFQQHQRVPKGNFAPLPKKTMEQLDRELDEYMRFKNSKHNRITM